MRRFLLPLVLVSACGPAGAFGQSTEAIVGSPCQAGDLVDSEFRDAALRVLERLVVQAPGRTSHGAVRTHHTAGHVDAQGQAWHQVSAYQVNLGLIGALRVAPQLLPLAADWLRWQARHMARQGASRGVVLDHWVRAEDFEESTCPSGMAHSLCGTVDAYDSTAASTLLMADAYVRQGGDPSVLREPLMREALEAAATALRELSTPEGLTLAKPTHRVAYTMDVVEVTAGWRAWARVQRGVYSEPQSGEISLGAARRGEAALRTHLWDPAAGAWRTSLGAGAPQTGRWYPDTVAQAWPFLWGTDIGRNGRAREAWRRAIARWQGPSHWAQQQADPDGFWWPAVAVAAHCIGDTDAARRWVARARRQWLDPLDPFPWPFQVGDLLWLLWLADPQPQPKVFPAPRPTTSTSGESR